MEPRIVLLVATLVVSAIPAAAQAQAQDQPDEIPRSLLRPMIVGHLGYASVERSKGALESGLSVDIGSYRTPRLRIAIGLDRLSTQPERGQTSGSYSDVSANVDLRIKPLRVRGVSPYFGAGVSLHFRSNDIPDPNVADIYDGVAAGIQGFLGLLVDGSAAGRWGVIGEVRAVRAQNLSRTSLRTGLFLRL